MADTATAISSVSYWYRAHRRSWHRLIDICLVTITAFGHYTLSAVLYSWRTTVMYMLSHIVPVWVSYTTRHPYHAVVVWAMLHAIVHFGNVLLYVSMR